MKLLTLTITLLVSLSSFAANMPEAPKKGAEKGRDGRMSAARLAEKTEAFNAAARSVLGQHIGENFEIKLPQGMNNKDMDVNAQRIESLGNTLKGKELELKQDPQKATEVASIIMALNKAYAFRPEAESFLKNNEAKISAEAKDATNDTIKLIDNLSVILETKLDDTVEIPVSHSQILRVINLIAGMKVTGLKAEDFIELETQVTSILPKNYTMAQAARCVK